MRGRRPAGPESIDQLVGSDETKARLQAILDTLYGQARLCEACAQLGVAETRCYQLRQGVVQAALTALAPRPAGRPSRAATAEAERIRVLEERVREREQAVHEAHVREEIALVFGPARPTPRPEDGPGAGAEKKTRPQAGKARTPR